MSTAGTDPASVRKFLGRRALAELADAASRPPVADPWAEHELAANEWWTTRRAHRMAANRLDQMLQGAGVGSPSSAASLCCRSISPLCGRAMSSGAPPVKEGR